MITSSQETKINIGPDYREHTRIKPSLLFFTIHHLISTDMTVWNLVNVNVNVRL